MRRRALIFLIMCDDSDLDAAIASCAVASVKPPAASAKMSTAKTPTASAKPSSAKPSSAAKPSPASGPPATLTITAHGTYVAWTDLERYLQPDGIRKLCAKLTHTYVAKIGNKQMAEKKFSYYRVQEIDSRKYLVVARHGGFVSAMLVLAPTFAYKTRCTIGPGLPMSKCPIDGARTDEAIGITLNANQVIVRDHLLAHQLSPASIAAGTGSAILVMATGTGKSYMGVSLAVHFGRKTLIVLPNGNNLAEWRAIITTRYPNLKLGQYDGKRKYDGDIVIAMIGSLLKPAWKFAGKGQQEFRSIDYFHQFGMVIYDEIHNYASPARLEAFWNMSPRIQLGLTATPDERADGMDHAYQQHVGDLVRAIDIPGYNPAQTKFEGTAHIIKYSGTPSHTVHHTSSLGFFDAGAGNQMVSEDPARRQLTCNIIAHALGRGRNVFIFAERLEQIAELQLAIAFPTTKLVGGQDESTNISAKSGQIIIMTYSFGSESISIPRMDTIIFYTSRRNKMVQKLGRIERGGGDESIIREVYDIVDVRTNLKKQLPDRKGAYVDKQYAIVTHKVDHTNVTWPPATA